MEVAIAISMLLATCKSLHGLESVAVKFQHVGTLHQTVRDRIPRKDPFHDISRMYGHVWFDLQDLLRSSLALRWASQCHCVVIVLLVHCIWVSSLHIAAVISIVCVVQKSSLCICSYS